MTSSTATGKSGSKRLGNSLLIFIFSMPLLMTKIEGKGNGIKTVIPNMSDVARALSRPPTYPTKFFGCELGAQTSFDEKNDRYIVNGAHDATRIRELLDGFIDKFVLCRACKNPETDLVIQPKTDMIIRDCKACGQRTDVDMRHKLTTFILKNPPKLSKSKKSAKAAGNAAAGAGATDSPEGEPGSPAGDGAESDDELSKRIKAEAAELNPETQLGKEDWSVDTSEAAVRARTKALEASMSALAVDDDEDEDENSPYAQLGRWAEENREAGPVLVYKKAEELGIEKKHRTVQILVQSIFTEKIVEEIPAIAPVFVKVGRFARCAV